jgi:hypothetical protein
MSRTFMRDGRRSRFADRTQPGSCQGGHVDMPFVSDDQVAAARHCVPDWWAKHAHLGEAA